MKIISAIIVLVLMCSSSALAQQQPGPMDIYLKGERAKQKAWQEQQRLDAESQRIRLEYERRRAERIRQQNMAAAAHMTQNAQKERLVAETYLLRIDTRLE